MKSTIAHECVYYVDDSCTELIIKSKCEVYWNGHLIVTQPGKGARTKLYKGPSLLIEIIIKVSGLIIGHVTKITLKGPITCIYTDSDIILMNKGTINALGPHVKKIRVPNPLYIEKPNIPPNVVNAYDIKNSSIWMPKSIYTSVYVIKIVRVYRDLPSNIQDATLTLDSNKHQVFCNLNKLMIFINSKNDITLRNIKHFILIDCANNSDFYELDLGEQLCSLTLDIKPYLPYIKGQTKYLKYICISMDHIIGSRELKWENPPLIGVGCELVVRDHWFTSSNFSTNGGFTITLPLYSFVYVLKYINHVIGPVIIKVGDNIFNYRPTYRQM